MLIRSRIFFALAIFCGYGWLLSASAANGPASSVVINEVFYAGEATDDWVEILNTGSTPVDVSQMWFCSRFVYRQLGFVAIIVGDDFILEPGELLVLAASIDLNQSSGADLALYQTDLFGNPDDMIDFVQWSTAQRVGRSNEAIGRGLWSGTTPAPVDFVPPAAAGESMAFCGQSTGGGSLTLSDDFVNGVPTPGMDNALQCPNEVLFVDGFEV